MNYFLDGVKRYVDFSGRARRKEFWMYFLFYTIFYFCTCLCSKVFSKSTYGIDNTAFQFT